MAAGLRSSTAEGRRRKTHVFRIVLSHSRKGYSEAVFRQNTESFIRALENAFFHFGGTVKTLVIDNLRAAVQKADWYEPELHPKLRSFCDALRCGHPAHSSVHAAPQRKDRVGGEVRQTKRTEGSSLQQPGRGKRIPAALGNDCR